MTPGLLLVALLAPPLARAHVPHDPTTFVASVPDPSSTRIAVAVGRDEEWLVARSDNDLDFDYRFAMEGWDYELTAGAYLSADRLLVGTRHRDEERIGVGLLISEDGGETFDVHPDLQGGASILEIEASPDVLVDGTAFACGMGALYASWDWGLSFEKVVDLPKELISDVDLSPDWALDQRLCAVGRTGALFCSGDGGAAFSRIAGPGVGAWSVSVGEGERLWVGGRAGAGLLLSEDGGETWAQAGLKGEDVVVVEDLGGGLILAATPLEAVWRSSDGGETWSLADQGIQALELLQSIDGKHFFDLRRAADGSILLASFEGPYRSRDEGRTWQPMETEGPWNVRFVTLVKDANQDLLALLGGYGSGPSIVNISQESARLLGREIPHIHTRCGIAARSWSPGTALYGAAGDIFRSLDGGESWKGVLGGDLGEFHRLAISSDEAEKPLMVAVGSDTDRRGVFRVSTDQGAHWTTAKVDVPCADVAFAVDISWDYANDGLAWASCDGTGAVYESRNQGQNWSLLGSTGAWIYSLSGTPGGEALFIGSGNGLYVSRQGAAPEHLAFDGDPVFQVAASPGWPSDPTLFALVLRDGWYRSDDAGESWTRLPAPTADMPRSLSLSPSFVEDGTLAVGGYNGAWVSEDRGESWRPIHAILRFEEGNPSWLMDGGWEVEADSSASNGHIAVSRKGGAAMTLQFRGIGLDLYSARGEGTLELSLDGGDTQSVDLSGIHSDKPSFSFRDLEDGRHALEVRSMQGGETLDVAVVWTLPLEEGDTEESPTVDEEGSCGCAGIPAHPGRTALVLTLLGLAITLRRRPGGN